MQPLIGQIIPVAFNFAPVGWLLCNGQTVSVADYGALFALIGTTFGGDGQQSFGLPDLRGATAIGVGQAPGLSGYELGQAGGSETVALTPVQLPSHNHTLGVTSATGSTNTPAGASILGTSPASDSYANAPPDTAMAATATTSAGGGLPHANIQPVLAINYIIAFQSTDLLQS